jgi:hypothetical protein
MFTTAYCHSSVSQNALFLILGTYVCIRDLCQLCQYTIAAIGQVVIQNDLVPHLHQHDSCMASDIAGSTLEKHIHRGYLFFIEVG